MSQSFTIKMPSDEAPDVHAFFAGHSFEFVETPHAFWTAKGPGVKATFYRSGKLLLQGKEADVWRGLLTEESAHAKPFQAALDRHPRPLPKVWGGTDEAGKGDYFGPLVVAGVSVRRRDLELLFELGVDDSKTLSDAKIPDLERAIKGVCRTDVLFIGPAKYNALYEKIGNLNRLMAWAHAKVISNLYAESKDDPVEWFLIDQFSKGNTMSRALGRLTETVRIDQWPKAESDPAVAAASILARAAFLRGVDALSKRYGVRLRLGAGAPTLASGREFIHRHGHGMLGEVAKLHFSTTEKLRS